MAKIVAVLDHRRHLVVIPNSLGAAELIVHYGTQAQKDHYLPRLARGRVRALLRPDRADRRLRRRLDQGRGPRVQGQRRQDQAQAQLPQALHHARADREPVLDRLPAARIRRTCWARASTPASPWCWCTRARRACSNGDHHEPIGEAFYNGPLIGKDVIVPVDNIIGGAGYAGQGWKMLMEQLAGGRAVSLPAARSAASSAARPSPAPTRWCASSSACRSAAWKASRRRSARSPA